MASYHVIGLHSTFEVGRNLPLFASVTNFLNARYATDGTLDDPTGFGAPRILATAVSNGPSVNNRSQYPAAPITCFGGVRLSF